MSQGSKLWIAAVVVAATAVAHADGTNEIRAVTFDDDSGVTRVHVRGADVPTFTAYKLDRPTRVVIDLPHAKLADALRGHESAATFTPSTWAVSTIAAQQLDDGTVRVIVTLARPGRYDVTTNGDEVDIAVTARDPAPKTVSPDDLARIQAETERAKAAASQAESARDTAQQQAAQSQAQAKAAQQQADAASQQAAKSRAESAAAMAEADRLRATAAEQAAKAAAAARDAKRATAAEAARAKAIADKAQADAQAAEQRADAATRAAQADAERANAATHAAQADAENAKAEAERAKAEAVAAREAAQRTQNDAAAQISKSRDDVARAQAAADKTKAEAAAALAAERAEAEKAKRDAAAARQDAAAARAEADRAEHETQAKLDAATGEASAAKDEVARAKADAETARAEARAEKTAADQARSAAAADKRAAEQMLADATDKLTALDKKTTEAQALEDRARAANAAATAREEAAQDAALLAQHERDTALAAAKQAEDAQKKAAASDRDRLAADATAAEQRLADAKRATDEAVARRTTAEQAATAAQQQLARSRTALADVEAQRATAVTAAGDAARKRSDAEAAASDAAHRRADAEAAARDAEAAAGAAAKQKSQAERERDDAEAERTAALAAARSAQLARDAADKQRQVAETAAHAALAAKQSAEQGLAELTDRRLAAEAAARDLEARAKAEAMAQAEIAAAEARKTNARDLDAARAELAKLAADRKHAEAELADRRKAVAAQQAESARLDTAATEAHAAAEREEARRAELAKQRSAEEKQLEQLDARVADAEAAAKVAQAHAEPPKPVVVAEPPKPVVVAELPKPVVVAEAPQLKLDKVAKVDFHGGQGTGQIDIAVGTGATVTTGDITGSRIELVVDHAELAPKLERTLDVSKFGSPVKSISSFRDRTTPDRVRVVVELAQVATPTVARDASGVHWRFATAQVRATNVPPPVVGGFGAVSTPIAQQSVTQLPPQGTRRHIYHGAPVDMDFDNAQLHEALRIIQDIGHINIVVPDNIDPRITVKLTQVPWDEALEVILSSHQLWYRKDGNIYRIAPRKELDQEDEAEAARREASLKAEAPLPETVTLAYANADQLRTQLQNLLSSKGHITVDKRTNTLIIVDVAGNRAEIAKLALKLDTQTPEISIEARIVEADSTFSRSFGIQWGGNGAASASGGNATGLLFPSSVGVAGGADDTNTNSTGVGASPSDFAVNLPATTGTNEGGALGISLGSIGGNFNINLRLSAAEDTGNVRIISSPKVTVLNNKHATISQGTSIPISVVSAAGTNTQFVQADLTLDVTPNVSYRDCTIAMDLHITNDQPDFSQTGPQGDPTIDTKTATTSMLVNDGETAVLGGIYTRNSAISYNKVPFLGDIPVLGWLFKKRTESDNRSEILVFITPRIVNRANLLCGNTQ